MTSCRLRQFPKQIFWGSMQIPSGSFFLEIFAGEAGLSQAISARGIPTLPPIEIEAGDFVQQSVDVLDPAVQAHLRLVIEAKVIFYIFFCAPMLKFQHCSKERRRPTAAA